MKTDDTSLTFSPLSPSTKYTFRVGVVNDDGQQGMEASATVTTKMETGGGPLHCAHSDTIHNDFFRYV